MSSRVVSSPISSWSRRSKSSSNAERVLGRATSERVGLGLVLKLIEEVIKVAVDFLRVLGDDRAKNRVHQVDAACDAFDDSIDAGEDVVGSDVVTMEEFGMIWCSRRRFVSAPESVFNELDALADVIIHTINLDDQMVRLDPWAGVGPEMACVASN